MFEAWQAMENFYYRDFLWLMALIVIGLIVLVATLMHIKHKRPRIIFVITLIITSALGLHLKTTYDTHADLIDKNQYVNAANRTYRRYPTMKLPYPVPERDEYRLAYLRGSFQKIGLYHPEKVTRKLDYLGQEGDYYYFQYKAHTFYIGKRLITFVDDLDQTQMVGAQYHLDDLKFEELGFFESSEVFIERVEIPTALKNKKADREEIKSAYYATDQIGLWIFPNYHSVYEEGDID